MKRFKLLRPGNKSLMASGAYEMIYSLGSMVNDDNTVGYILFDTMKNLLDFVKKINLPPITPYPKLFVAEVETIGDEFIPNELCVLAFMEKYLDEFYANGAMGCDKLPKGTICCKEIEVLDIQQLYPV
jgi:hypothetical protein